MKNIVPIAITILTVGCGGKDESTTETKPPEIEKEELPPIPDKVTKEFVMNLWSQPNDETDIIKEVKAHVKKSGIWILKRKKGPNKDELVNNEQARMTLKFANQRYMVWEFITDTYTGYSAITYDFEQEKYHWWEFGEDSERDFFAQYSGQSLDGNLIEWESVIFPAFENGKLKIRDISKTDNRIEMVSELWEGGEIIGATEDTLTWSEELPSRSEKNVEEENYLDGINSGDRIYYRYKGVGYEKTVGLEDNDDDFPNLVWFVSKEELKFQDLITFRSMDNTKKVTEGEWSSAIILWIKKHPDQLQMPPLTE